MGSDESHFNVSLIVRSKITTTFEKKGEPTRRIQPTWTAYQPTMMLLRCVRHYVTSSLRHGMQLHQENALATTKWRATMDTACLSSTNVTVKTTVTTVATKENAVS